MFQVSLVLSALQAGNKGTQACITAASAVSGIIADLDTTIMFASAGTLNPENEESFADHRFNDLATNNTDRPRQDEKWEPLIAKKEIYYGWKINGFHERKGDISDLIC